MKNRPLQRKILAASIITLLVVFACSTRPFSVLSEKKMEEILYDLYIAEAEVTVNTLSFASDTTRKNQLLDAVFKRHGVSRAKFDSSLVWYANNLDKYSKINDNIASRYDSQINELQRRTEKHTFSGLATAKSDSTRMNQVTEYLLSIFPYIALNDCKIGLETFEWIDWQYYCITVGEWLTVYEVFFEVYNQPR